jgi:hypothetical protein
MDRVDVIEGTLANLLGNFQDAESLVQELLGFLELVGHCSRSPQATAHNAGCDLRHADALHCNRRMVATIIEKGGDYCIALKCNQDSLLSDARACLAKADERAASSPNETSSCQCSRFSIYQWARAVSSNACGDSLRDSTKMRTSFRSCRQSPSSPRCGRTL